MNTKLTRILLATFLATSFCTSFATTLQHWISTGSMAADYGAGIAASTTNPDVSYYNPGAMTYFSGQKGGISTLFRSTSSLFKGNIQVSTIPNSDLSTNSQGGQLTFTPSFTYVAPLSKRWAFGLSVLSPMNANMYYSKSEATRYVVSKNQLSTIDIDPALAFQIVPKLSIGAGIDFVHGNFTYDNTNTVTSTLNDSLQTNKLSGWAIGYNVGAFWQATKKTKVGISYHSQANLRISGTSKFRGKGTLASNKTRAKSHLSIPSMAVLSFQQMVNDKWTLLGTAVYTKWSQLNKTAIRVTATPTGSTTITYINKLRSVWQYVLGAHYIWNQNVTLMGSLGFTQPPVDTRQRTIIIPDASQYSLSLGLDYTFNKSFDIIAGYTHLFQNSSGINATQTLATDTVTSIGRMYSNADIIGIEVNWKMT
jgi:long-chain fatty acid transport protein